MIEKAALGNYEIHSIMCNLKIEVSLIIRTPDEGDITLHTHSELLPQLKRVDTMKSGGEVTQEYVQQILNNDPDLLLADKPTTNLDTDHIEWVEKKPENWLWAFVIVSHDRVFLDALCTAIWEKDEGNITVYKGDYSNQKEV